MSDSVERARSARDSISEGFREFIVCTRTFLLFFRPPLVSPFSSSALFPRNRSSPYRNFTVISVSRRGRRIEFRDKSRLFFGPFPRDASATGNAVASRRATSPNLLAQLANRTREDFQAAGINSSRVGRRFAVRDAKARSRVQLRVSGDILTSCTFKTGRVAVCYHMRTKGDTPKIGKYSY